MRNIIHDQESQNFIEGPMQDKAGKGSLQERNDKKETYPTDISQGYDVYQHVDAMINDSERPFYWANERYD